MQPFDDTLSIRSLQAGDARALLVFYEAFSEEDARFFKPWPCTSEAIARHLADTLDARAISLVAVDHDGAILGHAFIQHITKPVSPSLGLYLRLKQRILAKLGRLCVPRLGIGIHASVRRRGLSKALLGRLIDEARRTGLPAVALGVHKANHGARRLYEENGFVITREISQQTRNDSYEMRIRLD